jgi:hypothetical protein
MPRIFRKAVRRTGDGGFEVRLSDDEREGLRGLFAQLASTLDHDSDDPALRALFPPTYAEDPVQDAAYQAMLGDDLRTARLGALATAALVTEATDVSEDELIACMQALNALRLVLAARLDITEDFSRVEPDDPDAQAYLLYHYLSGLLDEIVDVVGA